MILFECEVWQQWPCHVEGLICQWQYIFRILCLNMRFDISGYVMFRASYVNGNTFLGYSVWKWGLTTVAMSCSRPHMSMTIHFYDTLFECEVWQQWPCHVQGLICQWQYIFMILCLNVRFDNSGHVMFKGSYVNDNTFLWYSECEVWQQWPCHVQGLICQWQYIFRILCLNVRFDNSGHVMFKASYVNDNTFLWYSVWMWGLTTVAMSCSRPHMSMTIHF